MVPVNMIHFKVTLAHMELFLRILEIGQFKKFGNLLAADLRSFLMLKTSFRNWGNNGVISPSVEQFIKTIVSCNLGTLSHREVARYTSI